LGKRNVGECELSEDHAGIRWKPIKLIRLSEKGDAMGGWKMIGLLITGDRLTDDSDTDVGTLVMY
jgi:hypothetical protein